MATSGTLKKLNMTDSEHRHLFYKVQNQRCAVCDTYLVYGSLSPCDKTTKTFFCKVCMSALVLLRKLSKQHRQDIIQWAGRKA